MRVGNKPTKTTTKHGEIGSESVVKLMVGWSKSALWFDRVAKLNRVQTQCKISRVFSIQ